LLNKEKKSGEVEKTSSFKRNRARFFIENSRQTLKSKSENIIPTKFLKGARRNEIEFFLGIHSTNRDMSSIVF
jgi:hypothetical protein